MKRHYKRRIISDINVTPFVDVLLVLLVIFMVAAPMLNGNIEVNLPKGSNKSEISNASEKVIISIKNDGQLYVNDQNIKLSELKRKLLNVTANDLDRTILIKADKKLNYGMVMDIIKKINDIGFKSASLITEISE